MNELKYSDSPYLLQHANNPVHWKEWNNKSLELAKKEDKLIFLSIGYSTCHWCHVMEKESFKDKEIADILNKFYISIKVDREELSDIDKYYQKVYQLMHKRGGGWPLTIIMTPDQKVIFSATYMPKSFSHFGPGLKETLNSIAYDWHNNREKILKVANSVDKFIKENINKEFKEEKIDNNVIELIIREAKSAFDRKYGGLKGAPKFPMESMLDLLIDVYLLTKDKELYKILDFTFENMANGGIFDQVEGGFYRYSTDERWEIPHFEKMLYNNANIPALYIRFFQISNKSLYKEIALKSIDEMLNRYYKDGLFFSASNADSEGVEGKYFVYDYDEVEKEFNIFDNKDELIETLNIKKYGTFNGKNNITIKNRNVKNLNEALNILKNIRKKREFPFIDTKKITSWNSMMIDTLFKASIYNEKYKKIAINSLKKLIEEMLDKKLYHSFNNNKSQKKEALLEDYAYLIKTLFTAYEFTFDNKYIKIIEELLNKVFEFKYENNWYMNRNHTVKADFSDSSYASSLSILSQNFIKLSLFKYDKSLFNEAESIIRKGSYYINNYPLYYSSLTKSYLMKDRIYIITSEKPLLEENFNYPYIIFKKGENFEICKLDSCLGKSNNLEEIKKLIN